MGHRLSRLDEPSLIAVSKTLLSEFGIHHRFENCAWTLIRIFAKRTRVGQIPTPQLWTV